MAVFNTQPKINGKISEKFRIYLGGHVSPKSMRSRPAPNPRGAGWWAGDS